MPWSDTPAHICRSPTGKTFLRGPFLNIRCVLLNSILNSVPSYIPTSKLCIIDCSRVIIDRGSLIYQTLTQRFAGFASLVMVFVGLFLGLSRSPRIAMFVGTINDLPSSDSASHAKTPLVLVSHALNISP